MVLHVKRENVKRREKTTLSAVPLITEISYGTNASLMIGSRPEGYHSKPHVHDCEQLNYVIDGQLWLFVEKQAFLLKKGDHMRVPPNKLHWSWNKGPGTSILAEVHSPGLQADWPDIAIPLFDEGESTKTSGSPHNRLVDTSQDYISEVEKQAQ